MAKLHLSRMDVAALLRLRKNIDAELTKRVAELKERLEALNEISKRGVRTTGRVRSRLKGWKVSPKYRSASGETWAGRGARPRWLVRALKSGRRIEDFEVNLSARGRSRRRMGGGTHIVRHEDYQPPKETKNDGK
jgi:DNA-binding protein H-NS